ncbi:IDEAL domain-containing protein [Niallia taxi]|uniref:IDEAL domain-containing protein n=1 Tax=Niallia taxi TaxID=2499688 RepID=A0A437KHX7_9BACI|nr:IDEAL domain-containing protein [Niallia taxi]RVT67680.1 IDEAL domain-containing protein [Niallia taxi]
MAQSDVIFKKGEWVIVGTFHKWIGFITAISHSLREYEVNIVRRASNPDFIINKIGWIDFEDAELMDNRLSEDNLHQLIDMALDTKDREWFLELQSMLSKSEGVSL